MNKLFEKYYMKPKKPQTLYNIIRPKYYTGIGSRETPEPILSKMRSIGEFLAYEGYTLRSGAAEGADTAFEQGCDSCELNGTKGGQKEIYLPWFNFNGHRSLLYTPDPMAFIIAEQNHLYWHKLRNHGVEKLMARNVHQILGENLDSPSDFVIAYTEHGKGGTSFGISLAKKYNIPVFNLIDVEKNTLIIPKFLDFYEKCRNTN